MKFVFTVDTESDNSWDTPEIISLKNFDEIPKLQTLCEKFGIIPSYLLTFEYMKNDEAVKYFIELNEKNKCELGLHFHVWSTPPFMNKDDTIVDSLCLSAFQYEIDDDLFYSKIENLYELFVKKFGVEPESFRAGRWGIDQRTINWLTDRKFVVDSSIVPTYNFAISHGIKMVGPDYSKMKKLDPGKWYSSETNTNYIYELPLSVYRGGNVASKVFHLLNKKPNILLQVIQKLGYGAMLRPDPSYPVSLYKKFISQLIKEKTQIINMMIHSSELLLGGSPSSRDTHDLNKIWKILETVFSLIEKNEIEAVKISNAVKNIEISQTFSLQN